MPLLRASASVPQEVLEDGVVRAERLGAVAAAALLDALDGRLPLGVEPRAGWGRGEGQDPREQALARGRAVVLRRRDPRGRRARAGALVRPPGAAARADDGRGLV